MGGHGGLNILPQKRWNVYRQDNRNRVARDEAEDIKRRAELLSSQQRRVLHHKIIKLRQRGGGGDVVGTSQEISSEGLPLQVNEKAEVSTVAQVSIVAKESDDEEESYLLRSRNVTRQNPKITESINFFKEEEKKLLRREQEHHRYLTNVGHLPHETSSFSQMKSTTNAAWYLKNRNSRESQIFLHNNTDETIKPHAPICRSVPPSVILSMLTADSRAVLEPRRSLLSAAPAISSPEASLCKESNLASERSVSAVASRSVVGASAPPVTVRRSATNPFSEDDDSSDLREIKSTRRRYPFHHYSSKSYSPEVAPNSSSSSQVGHHITRKIHEKYYCSRPHTRVDERNPKRLRDY